MAVTRLVVSYPADLSAWGRDQLDTPWVSADLRRRFADVAEGETIEVFLDVGCCGDTLDVPLRLVRAEGSGAVADDATIDYVEGAACGLAGGWRVQSRAGPAQGDQSSELGAPLDVG